MFQQMGSMIGEGNLIKTLKTLYKQKGFFSLTVSWLATDIKNILDFIVTKTLAGIFTLVGINGNSFILFRIFANMTISTVPFICTYPLEIIILRSIQSNKNVFKAYELEMQQNKSNYKALFRGVKVDVALRLLRSTLATTLYFFASRTIDQSIRRNQYFTLLAVQSTVNTVTYPLETIKRHIQGYSSSISSDYQPKYRVNEEFDFERDIKPLLKPSILYAGYTSQILYVLVRMTIKSTVKMSTFQLLLKAHSFSGGMDKQFSEITRLPKSRLNRAEIWANK